MTKYNKIIKFIKKYRKLNIANFRVSTTTDTFILTAEYKGIREQLILPYK